MENAKAKAYLDEAFLALVGPRVPADDEREAEAKEAKKNAQKAGKAAATATAKAAAAAPAEAAAAPPAGAAAAASAVPEEGVFVARELKAAVNSPALLAEHKAVSSSSSIVR